VFSIVRIVLPIIVVGACVAIIILHGVRGIALLVVLAAVSSVPQTRVWRTGERIMVRLTGSRRAALVVVCVALIGTLIVVNVLLALR
jgi:hypothetical protein